MPYTKRKTMKLKSFENWLTARGLEPKVNKISEASNDGNEMLKNNLNDIIEYATKLSSVVESTSELDEWMENKITVARTYLSDVTHAYLNDLKKQSSCGGMLGQASEFGPTP
jgi:hypothetical protein